MVFKNREEAAEKLAEILKKDREIICCQKNIVVVSLLRGGAVVGDIIAKKLKAKHLVLPVAKIPAPFNSELAIGALCFDKTYREKNTPPLFSSNRSPNQNCLKIAQEKFDFYLKKFRLKKTDYDQRLKNKIIVLVDDGLATGSSVMAALMFIKTKKPKKIFLAVPVAPLGFKTRGFDKIFILHRDPCFSAVSQFYQYFPQVEDEQIKELFDNKK